MTLIDYILSISKGDDNIIVSDIKPDMCMYYTLTEWSKTNKDYLVVVCSNSLRDYLIECGSEFKNIICLSTFTKIKNGKINNNNVLEKINEGKIIFSGIDNAKLLEKLKFKIALSFASQPQFSIINYDHKRGYYSIRKHKKEIINFSEHFDSYTQIRIRNNNIDKVLNDD